MLPTPESRLVQLVDHDDARRHRVGDPQRLTRPLFRLANQRAHQGADVQQQCGPAGLVAKGFRTSGFPTTRRTQKQDPTSLDVGPPAGPKGTRAKRLEGLQPAQVGEGLAASMQREQATFLERLGLELPEHVGRDPVVPDQGQAQRILGLDPGQARRRIQHGRECIAVGQLAVVGGDAPGDPLELVAAGQVMLDHDELPLQFDGDIHHGRKDDHEGPPGLAGGDRRVEGLDDLDIVQEPVEVPQDEQRRALGIGHGPQRADGGQRIGGIDDAGGILGPTSHGEAAVDVPGG